MRPRRILDRGETAELIGRAVADHALAVLSVRRGAQWITFKSKFLERDPNGRFFVLDHQETHGAEPPELEPGQQIGVSFRHKSRKIMFASVVEAKGRFLVDDSTSVTAIRYRWPESITEMQRRAYHRTIVPPSAHMRTTFWAGGSSAREDNEALSVWGGESLDLSCGGTLIQLGAVPEPTWLLDQVLGVEIELPDGRSPLMLDAYYRGTRRDEDNQVYVATQFVGLEMTEDGRTALHRLARCIQRFHRAATLHEERPMRPR